MNQLLLGVFLCWQVGETQELLQRIAAIRDDHDRLFTSGYAKYAVTVSSPNTYYGPEVEVWFSGRRVRFRTGGRHELFDGGRYLSHSEPGPNTLPLDHIVHLNRLDLETRSYVLTHPAWLGHWIPPVYEFLGDSTLAKYFREIVPQGKMDATFDMEDNKLKVHCRNPNSKMNFQMVLDPERAYAITSFRAFQDHQRVFPFEATFTFDRRGNELPHVATAARLTTRSLDKGEWSEFTLEARLLEFRLEEVPDSRFTLEDFPLPRGARLLNSKTGEQTLLGVDAVSREDIDREIVRINEEFARGPAPAAKEAKAWWPWLLVAAAVGLLALLAWWALRLRRPQVT
ncbi:MAG TPA: hypothetical protein PKD86_16440 [Gemmatales bacterium]|nr:hypothetical protein [Gemmatales bacterium]HMP60935.1 hypothetical protein [Gemmatales bacterium]